MTTSVIDIPTSRTTSPADPIHAALHRTWRRPPGLKGWLISTDHKEIGLRFICTALIVFVLAGIMALLMRWQLAVPNNSFMGPDRYNQLFPPHGTAMMFLFAVP